MNPFYKSNHSQESIENTFTGKKRSFDNSNSPLNKIKINDIEFIDLISYEDEENLSEDYNNDNHENYAKILQRNNRQLSINDLYDGSYSYKKNNIFDEIFQNDRIQYGNNSEDNSQFFSNNYRNIRSIPFMIPSYDLNHTYVPYQIQNCKINSNFRLDLGNTYFNPNNQRISNILNLGLNNGKTRNISGEELEKSKKKEERKSNKEKLAKLFAPISIRDLINKSEFYIYILKCESGKYYIGKTQDLKKRLADHVVKQSCKWTRTFKPLEIIEILISTDCFDEDKWVKKYMIKKGIDNVRGGSYCQLNLTKTNKQSIFHEIVHSIGLCYYCLKKNHLVNQCIRKIKRFTKGEEFHRIKEQIIRRGLDNTVKLSSNPSEIEIPFEIGEEGELEEEECKSSSIKEEDSFCIPISDSEDLDNENSSKNNSVCLEFSEEYEDINKI